MTPATTANIERWVALVRAAVVPGRSVSFDELLIVRDIQGRSYRPTEPPEGMVARPGAVLLLLYPDGDDLRLPLTVRSDALPTHRGEVSLPGGATDPQDSGPVATALRECHEELGVEPQLVQPWGELTPIYIPPSNFRITPVVGFTPAPPTLALNTAEVSAVLAPSLRDLLDPATVVTEEWTLRGMRAMVPFFALEGHKVWGATALILSEFVARLRQAMPAARAA